MSDRSRSGGRVGYALVVAFVLVSSLAQAGRTQVQRQDNILGKQLFEGLVMVPAKMSGHSVALPAEASRCSNCHANASAMRSTDVALGQTRAFATPLNQTTLNTVFARRGGPASRYDSLSFCKVVREGIDPRQVVINSAMPRYPLSDAQCAAIWSYVMSYS